MMLSIVWTIISYALGAFLRMRERAQEYQIEQQRALMQLAGMKLKDTADARSYQTSESQFTRRIVMITVTLCLMVIMLYGVIHGGNMVQPITVTEGSSGFWSMIFGGGSNTSIEFIKVPLSMTVALAWDLFSVMVGFYFGSGGTRR